MNAQEILARSAARLEEPGGWAQIGFGEHGIRQAGRACVAMEIWKLEYQNIDEVVAATAAFMREIGAKSLDDVFEWNDAPGRTVEEVAGALRDAKRWL